MSAESGLPTIIERSELLTGRLITKLSNPNISLVKTLAKPKLTQKKKAKRFSALSRILCFAKQYNNPVNYPVNYPATPKLKHPAWRLQTASVNLSLFRWNKTETPASTYRKEYAEILEKFENHDLLFTDGSKSDFGTGFSVVKQTISITIPIDTS